LKSIHKAGVVHGDVRLPNLCTTSTEEAFIVDFSHASESRSRDAKKREVKELCQILGIEEGKARAKPAVRSTVDETGLRRSSRIKEMMLKVKVEQRRAHRRK
jgi:tRNA A-37 threonylcarbamoyl transferase component Bud32